MPSAEHAPARQADPGPPGAGTVIHLADRRPGGPAAGAPTTATSSDTDPAQELAFTVQAMYAARGQSLTDPDTALAFETALGAVLLMVDGARAQDVVDGAQHLALKAMLEDMKQAPQLV